MLVIPITYRKACEYVEKFHRHHAKPQGMKFAIGCMQSDKLVGVAIAGRPISRVLDTGHLLEITRVCTDGTYNACSKLYGAVCRIAREMGYQKVITYTLKTEHGSSLKASGFVCDLNISRGGSWTTPKRQRVDKAPLVPKQRWVRTIIK